MTIDMIGGQPTTRAYAPETEGAPSANQMLYGEDTAAEAVPDTGETTDTERAALPDEIPQDGRYDFTMPEGVELDKALAEEAMPVLAEAGLTRAQADKLAGFLAEVRGRENERLTEGWAKTQADWVRSVKTDKEIGGEQFAASVAASNRLIARHGTPEFIDYLQSSGAGNHPEMVRFCTRIAAALSEDSPVSPEVPAASRRHDHVDILYPETTRG